MQLSDSLALTLLLNVMGKVLVLFLFSCNGCIQHRFGHLYSISTPRHFQYQIFWIAHCLISADCNSIKTNCLKNFMYGRFSMALK